MKTQTQRRIRNFLRGLLNGKPKWSLMALRSCTVCNLVGSSFVTLQYHHCHVCYLYCNDKMFTGVTFGIEAAHMTVYRLSID